MVTISVSIPGVCVRLRSRHQRSSHIPLLVVTHEHRLLPSCRSSRRASRRRWTGVHNDTPSSAAGRFSERGYPLLARLTRTLGALTDRTDGSPTARCEHEAMDTTVGRQSPREFQLHLERSKDLHSPSAQELATGAESSRPLLIQLRAAAPYQSAVVSRPHRRLAAN